MSTAVPNVAQLRQQTDAALSQLIDEGTSDGTTANLIEVLHSLCRRVELLEAMAPQVTASWTITQQVPPGEIAPIERSTTDPPPTMTGIGNAASEPAAEEDASDGVSPEAAG